MVEPVYLGSCGETYPPGLKYMCPIGQKGDDKMSFPIKRVFGRAIREELLQRSQSKSHNLLLSSKTA
jgi:hypothetical protein